MRTSKLREIQSTARRFELTELQSNAFSDVSDFVQALSNEGRLAESYPQGLVEAAYAMSAGNFGWFNVVMASIDERLRDKRLRGEKDAPTVGALFDELVKVSGRVRQHILDHHAIEMLRNLRPHAPRRRARPVVWPTPDCTGPALTGDSLGAARSTQRV